MPKAALSRLRLTTVSSAVSSTSCSSLKCPHAGEQVVADLHRRSHHPDRVVERQLLALGEHVDIGDVLTDAAEIAWSQNTPHDQGRAERVLWPRCSPNVNPRPAGAPAGC
jgi:hypothetical protein